MRKIKPKFQNKTRQKKRDTILYRCFMTAIAVFVFHFMFIESHYFGNDYRYDLYVFWIPTLIGFFGALKFNIFQIPWNEHIADVKKEKNYFGIPLLVLAHFMFALIFFWIPANIVWDALNKIESQKNRIEMFTVPVKKFTKSTKGNKIHFYFKNNYESIKVDYQTIKPYLDKNPSNYKVDVEVRKGLWNHYILESWDIR